MGRRRNRRRESGSRHVLYYIGGSTLILIVVAAVVSAFVFKPTPVELDRATGCPIAGPSQDVAVLIDRTDQISPVTAEDARQQLDAIVGEIPTYGRIEVFTVEPTTSAVLKPLVVVCNPGNAQTADPFFSSPQLIAKHWKERYHDPISGVLKDLLSTGRAPASPIMESVASVSATTLEPASKRVIPRRLVVVSDLLQHSDAFSLYKETPDFSRFLSRPNSSGLDVALRGVEIDLLLVQRRLKSGVMNDGPYLDFWMKWLTRQDCGRIRIVKLMGDNPT